MIFEELKQAIKTTRSSGSWLSNRKVAAEIRKVSSAHPDDQTRIAFLSSFTVEPLVDYLLVESAGMNIPLDCYIGGYGQVAQEILDAGSNLHQFNPEITFIIAEDHSLSNDPVGAATQLNAIADTWIQTNQGILVLCTFTNVPQWPYHILPEVREIQLQKANEIIKQKWLDHSQVQICDLDLLAAYTGYRNAFSPQMMSMARIPFSESFLAVLAQKLNSYILAAKNCIKKCLVLDCDNTLWGGIIGEDGMDGIKIGPDWPGREFIEFQKAILELYEQGVILAINSKNNLEDVMKVLREHPHMLLRENHFAGIQANWQPKPENMKQLAADINIGLDTIVFIDDNPAEREMMQQMLPEVTTLDMPENPSFYDQTLRNTNLFAKAFLTEEDRKRGQIYAAQRQRTQLQQSVTNLEEFLRSLDMICTIRFAEESDIKRVSQLTQRTNQFNLTTRRYSEIDIQNMLKNPDWNIYVLNLKDKFGDNGTVGLALINKSKGHWIIDTFLMSCRIIGRQAEDALVDRICQDAKKENISILKAEYISTAKNKLVKDFWDKMEFDCIESKESAIRYQRNLEQFKLMEFKYLKIQ